MESQRLRALRSPRLEEESAEETHHRVIPPISIHIPGKLPSLNEILSARGKVKRKTLQVWSKYTSIKNYVEQLVEDSVRISRTPKVPKTWYPVHLLFTWTEANKKRDKGNIRGAEKFITDGLIKSGILEGDSWKYIESIFDVFQVDPDQPGVTVNIFPKNSIKIQF